jgi:hypothetical protein
MGEDGLGRRPPAPAVRSGSRTAVIVHWVFVLAFGVHAAVERRSSFLPVSGGPSARGGGVRVIEPIRIDRSDIVAAVNRCGTSIPGEPVARRGRRRNLQPIPVGTPVRQVAPMIVVGPAPVWRAGARGGEPLRADRRPRRSAGGASTARDVDCGRTDCDSNRFEEPLPHRRGHLVDPPGPARARHRRQGARRAGRVRRRLPSAIDPLRGIQEMALPHICISAGFRPS